MSRTAAALLGAALLLTGAAPARGAEEGRARQPVTPSEQVEESASQVQRRQGEAQEIDELPIYIPPQRGSILTRVGGASRGGSISVHSL